MADLPKNPSNSLMRTRVDHLPYRQQRELPRVVEILHDELSEAVALASLNWKRRGRIVKIILFGSYARGGWVDEPHTAKGYQSDFDILVIVNHQKLTDFAEFWCKAEDRIMLEPAIRTPVNFIVHTINEVNEALREGQYFYCDIVQEGISLYNQKGSASFIKPQPLTPEAALKVAKRYFDSKMPLAENALRLHADSVRYDELRDAAFLLHQTVERLYSCYLLARTNYTPASHNIKFLRSLCESMDARFIDAWPRELRRDNARFELLKKAYVEARYSDHFSITLEDIHWLAGCIEQLLSLVKLACEERLLKLESETMN